MFIKRTSIGGRLFVEMRYVEYASGYCVDVRETAVRRQERPWEIRADGSRSIMRVYTMTREEAEGKYRAMLDYPRMDHSLRLR